MSAGEVQLASLGMQDVYLTGTPQITYFKGVYRRHTPFGVQSFNIPFENQQISWGGQGICRVPFKGDTIQSTTLAVTLPQLFPFSTQFRWRQPAQTMYPQPYLFINNYTTYSNTNIGAQTNFTVPDPSWIGPQLTSYGVTYSSSANRFQFSTAITKVGILSADVSTVAVFWGLDPNGFSSIGTINGQAAKFWTSQPTFTVTQSGWIPYSLSATTNEANSLLYVGPSTLGTATPVAPLAPPGPFAQFATSTYIQFQNFSSVIGTSYLIKNYSDGGNIQFNYAGIYGIFLTPSGLGAPTRIGIGHTSSDGHPIFGYTYDYVYTYNVQFSGQNPRALLPIFVTDPSQFYFVEFEGASGTTFSSDVEVLVKDILEFWTVGTSTEIDGNRTINWSGLTRSSIVPQLIPSADGKTFKFGTIGLYNIYGSISVNPLNTISSVYLVKSGPVISRWNSPQSSSPSVNFTLPVSVTSTEDSFSLVISSNDQTAPTSAIAPTSFSLEYIGNTTINPHPNDFKQNGLLLNPSFTNYPTATSNINIFSTSTGSSYHVAVTPGGNLSFSNVSQYRISSYVETSNAYVSNVTIWSAQNDATFSVPGGSALVASRDLPLGLQGGYTVDLIVPVTVPSGNYFQIRVGFTGQAYTNITSNTYFTVVGMTNAGIIPNYSYVDSVGTYMIQSAELKIGGQSIQTLTGEMIEIYNDLFVPQENQSGLTLLTGKKDTSPVYNPRTYYINLPFFFYGSAELSLPVCALGLQDLEVWVTFKDYQSLLGPGVKNPTPLSVITSLIVDYAYLSQPEIEWFQKHRQDYIIRQIQYDTFKLYGSLTFPIDFLGPVREMYFVIQDSAAYPYVYVTDQALGVDITFNGEDYIDSSTTDYNFMRFIGPLEKYARQPDRILHVIPLCRQPLNPRPTGSVSMDRIYQKTIKFTFSSKIFLATKTIRLMAVVHNILRVENGLAGIMYQ